ncbi:MAG: hypothetical protein PF440_07370 [Thiomicrorhabdus sp.]|nr:hypothetical protein [Thiomicrorhabdus sp.]
MVLDEDAGWIVNTDSLRRYDKHAIEVVSTNLSTNETSVCATSCSFNYFNEDIILFRPLVQDYDKPCKETTPLTYASPEEERAFETLDSTLQAKKARETSIATSADSQRPTLRDQLAMAALPGLIAEYPGINKLPLTLAQHTHNAYVCADEMLEARKS